MTMCNWCSTQAGFRVRVSPSVLFKQGIGHRLFFLLSCFNQLTQEGPIGVQTPISPGHQNSWRGLCVWGSNWARVISSIQDSLIVTWWKNIDYLNTIILLVACLLDCIEMFITQLSVITWFWIGLFSWLVHVGFQGIGCRADLLMGGSINTCSPR